MSPDDEVRFFETLEDAQNNENPILNSDNYTSETTPKEIFIRIEGDNCYSITLFILDTKIVRQQFTMLLHLTMIL